VAPKKSKPLPNYHKIVLSRILAIEQPIDALASVAIYSLPMRLHFFVKLKKWSSTIL